MQLKGSNLAQGVDLVSFVMVTTVASSKLEKWLSRKVGKNYATRCISMKKNIFAVNIGSLSKKNIFCGQYSVYQRRKSYLWSTQVLTKEIFVWSIEGVSVRKAIFVVDRGSIDEVKKKKLSMIQSLSW